MTGARAGRLERRLGAARKQNLLASLGQQPGGFCAHGAATA
jgi:hypothetical protein